MKHGIQYYPGTDMLTINLSSKPASGGGEVVTDGVVIHYDEDDKINYIEISAASDLVDLAEIKKDPALVVDEETIAIYTPSTIADELGVSIESVHKTLQAMRKAGLHVGRPVNPNHTNSPLLLTAVDFEAVKQWRVEHRRGRPRKKVEEGPVEITAT